MTGFLDKQSRSSERHSRAGKSSKPAADKQEVTIKHFELIAYDRLPIDRHRLIAEAAYRLAESRGFAPGHELDDWLSAEAEVDDRLWSEGRMY